MRIILKNKDNRMIEISEYSDYALESINGLGDLVSNLYTSKSPNQDGESYQGNTLGSRDINIELSIVANNKEDMLRKRDNILKVVNSKLGKIDLIYINGSKENKIKGILENVNFPHEENFEDSVQKVLIDLYCPNPFFTDIADTKEEIAIWHPAFEFALEIVEEGIEMGYREPSLIVNVLNKGRVESGMKIRFKALATLTNPSLFNINTREFFKINKTMEAGEVITVTTHFQNKRVELNKNNIISNAFNWIDLDSTFLQLDPGDNLFRYDADEGLDNLEVDIYHSPQYLGV